MDNNIEVEKLRSPLDKEGARAHFEYHTKKLNLKHTFSFDEVWDGLLKKRFQNGMMNIETKILEHPQCLTGDKIAEVNPLKHTFADGCYVREIFNPKGELIITKIHKIAHPYFLIKGAMSILTETGVKRIKAPHYGITPAGTKRLIYTHEDCVFVTVHVTKETDIKKIEDEVIAKDFNEINTLEEQKFINVILEQKEIPL